MKIPGIAEFEFGTGLVFRVKPIMSIITPLTRVNRDAYRWQVYLGSLKDRTEATEKRYNLEFLMFECDL